jgi:hypothetical protein
MTIYHSSTDVPTGSGPVSSRNFMAAISAAGGIETPSTLPELEFSWGDTYSTDTPTDIESWIDMVEASILGTGNSWRVLDELSQAGGAQRSLLVGGPLGSPVANARVLFTIGSAAAPTNRSTQTISAADYTYVGFAPDAGAAGYNAFVANGGTVGDPWDGGGANPFGAARFTGHAAVFNGVTANGCGMVYAADSTETLYVAMTRSAGTYNCGVYLGATIIPPHDNAAEADGRVYGMHVGGTNGFRNDFNSSGIRFPAHETTTNAACSYLFDPTSPTTIQRIYRFLCPGGLASMTDTLQGPRYGFTIPVNDYSGNGYGWFRQLVSTSDTKPGDSWPDVDGAPITFGISNSLAAYYDGIMLVNLPHTAPSLCDLPKLTFSLGAAQNLAVTTDVEDWADAIDAAVNATTNTWRVLDRLNQAGGTEISTLIGGPVGSPVENCRIICTIGTASVPNSRFYQTYSGVGYGYIGYAPEAGAAGYNSFVANGGTVADPFASVPFGTERWSGHAAWCRDQTTTGSAYIRVIDSLETLTLTATTAANAVRTAYVGATMCPPSSLSADADGRLHGIHVSNPAQMRSAFNTGNYFPAHQSGTLEACSLVFLPSGTLLYPSKFYSYAASTNVTSTSGGLEYGAAYELHADSGTGWMRQVGAVSDAVSFTTVTDKDATVVGYVVARSSTASDDAVGFLNYTNIP